jgi:transposase InsO family protein
MTETLLAERKLAIMQIKQGKPQKEVAQSLNRSPAWVAKWYKRYKEKGWSGLREESRAPKKHGKRLAAEVRIAICQARQEIEAEAGLDEGLKYKGGQAVRTRLKKNKVEPLPSVSTIERVLHEAGLTQAKSETIEPEVIYPHLQPTAPHQLHQVDIVPHYLEGGERISCFNAIDVVSRYPSGLAFAQHRAEDATAFLRQMWAEMGIAQYTQVDNEGCFSGGATHPYVLGQVVRLALTVGTELVFSPIYHPQSNGYVERFHQDYNQHVWEDTYLENLAAVNKKGHWFFSRYRLRQDHSQLQPHSPTTCHQEQTPRHLPIDFTLSSPKMPLREGRIHFMRRVSPQGTIRVLNVDWSVPRFDPLKGVWVTIEFRTSGALLSIFDATPDTLERVCLATYSFPLKESVLPLTHIPESLVEKDKVALPKEAIGGQPIVDRKPLATTSELSILPPLKPINGNLLKRSSRLALTTLQFTVRLTREAFSTMY